jgi:hypothetical protein
MSRKREPRKRANRTAPHDGTRLGHLSEAELLAELARRRMPAGRVDLEAMEDAALDVAFDTGEEVLASTIEGLPPEGSEPKPCPKCGKAVPVKTHHRVRHLLTAAGELRLSRNYHYCKPCRHGFCPRDLELGLPSEGEVSSAMERRILDFGVNTSFEAAAERWSVHYPRAISSNLVRRVVDRVGRRAEAAHSELTLQCAALPTPEALPRMVVVGDDGSMLNTREQGWKEAKVAVVAASNGFEQAQTSRELRDARYVAVLGGQGEFRNALAAALAAARADEVGRVVWLGDGAREIWTLASELCPFAVQVLDFMHAVQHGAECGRVLLGDDPAASSLWLTRLRQLLDSSSPEAAIRELMDCLPLTSTEEEVAALDGVIGYYRSNEARMRYAEFRERGLPIGSGIVESAHKHVLQSRMKQAGQRWSLKRARRMARLRAVYRTAGARRFHRAIREALCPPPPATDLRLLPNGPRRAKRGHWGRPYRALVSI